MCCQSQGRWDILLSVGIEAGTNNSNILSLVSSFMPVMLSQMSLIRGVFREWTLGHVPPLAVPVGALDGSKMLEAPSIHEGADKHLRLLRPH